MSPDIPHISVCICAYRRSEWLQRLLLSLQRQQTEKLFSYSIVVADNDESQSAQTVLEEFSSSNTPITYCAEPVKNIALVRNRAINAATGNWIAFIDDDEFPVDEWLLHLFKACNHFKAQGVLGPVRPHFDLEPPAWVRKCGLYERPEHPTGFVMAWRESRTGNVLFRRDILAEGEMPFSAVFSNGGEDQDFFKRMMKKGNRFIWCKEAIVYESVPPARWNKRIMMQRALLRGKNTLKHADVTVLEVVKSVTAVAAYICILPLVTFMGTHLMMRYLVKLCDHLGKLLATLGINPVRERVG